MSSITQYQPFAKSREAVHLLQLKSKKDWYAYSSSGRRPKDIPSQPYRTYKDEWRGWGDWLGTGTIASFNRKFLPFYEAQQFARGLGLKSSQEWITGSDLGMYSRLSEFSYSLFM